MAATVGTLLVEVIGDTSSLAASLGNAEKTVQSFGSRIFNAGTRVAAGISLPIAAFMKSVATIGIDLDSAMTKSLAIMDDVSAEMKAKMEQRAIDLSKISKFSAKEIAAGYYDLASAGLDATGAFENIGTVTKFAQAGLMSMETAGEHLAGAVKALGADLIGTSTDAEAMARVADVLTAANNHALGTVEDFSQALTTRFASGMRSVNIELEEGVAFLMAFAKQNIKGKEASQQAWMALRDLQTRAIKSSDAFKKYGIAVYNSNKELLHMSEILSQFDMATKGYTPAQIERWRMTGVEEAPEGRRMAPKEIRTMMLEMKIPDRSVTALQKVIYMGEEVHAMWEILKNSVGEVTKVFDKQGEAVSVKLAAAWHSFEEVAVRLFKALGPIIYEVIDLLEQLAEKLLVAANKFNELDDSTKKWILTIAGAGILLGPVMMLIGSMSLALGAIGGMLKTVAKGVSAVGFAFLTWISPATAAAAFPQKFKAMNAALDSMKSVVGAIGRLIGQITTPILTFVKKWGLQLMGVWAIYKMLEPAIKEIFKGFSFGDQAVNKAKGTWDALKTKVAEFLKVWDTVASVANSVWRVLKVVFDMIQTGWVLIVRLFQWGAELISGYWTDLVEVFDNMKRQFMQNIYDLGDDIVWATGVIWKMVTDLAEWIRKIPILGDVADATIYFIGTLLSEFGGMIAYIFRKIGEAFDGLEGKFKTFQMAVMKYTPWAPILKTIALLKGGTGIDDILDKEATAFEKWWARTKAIALGYDQFLGKTQQLEAILTRSGVAIDPSKMPPIGPVDNAPPWADPNASSRRDPVRDAFDELMGEGGRTWKYMAQAWEKYKTQIRGNEDAMLRLWDIYKGVRDTVEKIPDLEEAFAVQIAAENIERLRAAYGDLFDDLYGKQTTKNPLAEHIFQLQDFIRTQANMLTQTNMWGKATIFSPEFFKKHGESIEDLSKNYGIHSMEISLLIEEYEQWKAATEGVEQRTRVFLQSQEAFSKMIGAHADMAAKLKDKEFELTTYRLGESDNVLRLVAKNYNQQEREYDKMLANMAVELNKMTGHELKEGERLYIELIQMRGDYLQTVKDLELARLAETLGVDRLILRSFMHMTEAQKKQIVKIRAAANELMRVWKAVSSGFEHLANVFDKEGGGTLSWLAHVISLMEEATDVSANLEIALKGIGAAINAEGGIDWKAFGQSAAAAFQLIAQGISILDRATSSASKAKNVIGGAMAGAQMGMAFGPWGALIGAGIGAIVGAIRRSGVNEELKRVANEWGVTISEELAKTINDEAKKLYGGNRQLAELMNFGAILEEAGGLSTDNIAMFTEKMHDFFVMVETGALTGGQAMAEFSEQFGAFADFADNELVDLSGMFIKHFRTMTDMVRRGLVSTGDMRRFLDENFQRFADNIERTGGIASRAFNEMMTLIDQMGVKSEAVKEFFRNTTGEAGTTWETIIKGITYGFQDLTDEIATTREEIKELEKELADGGGAETQQELARAQDKLNRLLAEGKAHAAAVGPELQRMGGLLLGIFDAALRKGVGWSEAMGLISGALTDLQTAFDTLGMQADNPALQALMNLNKIFTENRALFEGIDAMVKGIGILSKMGILTQSTFDTMNAQIQDMFKRTEAVMIENGGTSVDALRSIVPYLEQVRKAAKEYGFVIDENTQGLIDQAIKAGLMGTDSSEDALTLEEALKGVGDEIRRMVDLLQEAFKKMGLLVDKSKEFEFEGPGGFNGDDGKNDDRGGNDRRDGRDLRNRNTTMSLSPMLSDLAASGYPMGTATHTASGDVIVLPVVVTDPTKIDQAAERALQMLPGAVGDNKYKIKTAIIQAARATAVPTPRKRGQ